MAHRLLIATLSAMVLLHCTPAAETRDARTPPASDAAVGPTDRGGQADSSPAELAATDRSQPDAAVQDGAATDSGTADHPAAGDATTDAQAFDSAAADAGPADTTAPTDAAVADQSSGDAGAADAASCGPCAAGETCVLEQCAPVAVLMGRPGAALATFWCPPGYVEAGRWRPGPGAQDGAAEALDLNGYAIDQGWVWLCSADPAMVRVVAAVDDCGASTTACGGTARGAWHVGAGCSGGTGAVDSAGVSLIAGWLQLCVQDGVAARVEVLGDDCASVSAGCGADGIAGRWHSMPASCGGGSTVVGADGQSVESGWAGLCVQSDRYPPVATDTLTGKVLAGYQGWFGTPGDGSQRNAWVHWFRSQDPGASQATFDLWPDLSQLPAAARVATSMTMSGGGAAELFSSYRAEVVDLHFRWMAEQGLDGVFLQRFVVEIVDAAGREFRDQVTRNAIEAAERWGRVFVIMYDISGAEPSTLRQTVQDDWQHLVDDLGVTRSPRYLGHRGKPLVAIWGFGFEDRPGTPSEALALIAHWQGGAEPRLQASVMGGVPTHWRSGSGDSQAGYDAVYAAYDVLSPWSVGRYSDDAGVTAFRQNLIAPDLAVCSGRGQDYLPVVWPGFSWANLMQDPGLRNAIPRRGGRFFWNQIDSALQAGSSMLYIAMFDEVDEGTAVFRAAASAAELPAQGWFLALDADGESVPADWYLRLTAAASKTVRGQIARDPALPLR